MPLSAVRVASGYCLADDFSPLVNCYSPDANIDSIFVRGVVVASWLEWGHRHNPAGGCPAVSRRAAEPNECGPEGRNVPRVIDRASPSGASRQATACSVAIGPRVFHR